MFIKYEGTLISEEKIDEKKYNNDEIISNNFENIYHVGNYTLLNIYKLIKKPITSIKIKLEMTVYDIKYKENIYFDELNEKKEIKNKRKKDIKEQEEYKLTNIGYKLIYIVKNEQEEDYETNLKNIMDEFFIPHKDLKRLVCIEKKMCISKGDKATFYIEHTIDSEFDYELLLVIFNTNYKFNIATNLTIDCETK